MSEERFGPYRLGEMLGAGATGTVHAATAVKPGGAVAVGSRVALKVLHPYLLGRPRFFERFRREAEVGLRLDHPNVVRTLGIETVEREDGPHHALVMEWVEGRTLRQLLEEMGRVPEALLRELAVQIVGGLAAIHRAGIVHRDLKPENVLVTRDHRIRIMDLGVARLLDPTQALTRQGEFAGTLPYASPEQLSGAEVGPAADLYALGVLLFELASGWNPFHHEDVSRIVAAHLHDAVPSLADQPAETSPFLVAIVGELLRKDPGDRPGPTEGLRTILGEGEESSWWVDREKEIRRRRAEIPAIAVPRETPIHGRAGELERLGAVWRDAREGRGRALLIEGETGIGKTRLLDAFLGGLDGGEAYVLYGSYAEGDMAGLSGAIRSRFGVEDLESTIAPLLAQTPRLIPDFAALVRNEGYTPGVEPVRGEVLHALICQLMRGLAAERPVLWIVEDLDRAEPASRAIVLAMARALVSHPVLLVLTAEPGIPDPEMAEFRRVPGFEGMILGRLSPREVVTLLQDALRSDSLVDRLGAKIAYKSDGVPLYVFEMIRGLEEGALIRCRPDGTYVATQIIHDIEVPSAVRDLIQARLAGLSREERAILDVAAVLGIEFDVGLIARVLDRRKVAVLQDLAEIERRGGIVRSDGGRCRFDHHEIREVVLDELLPELREEYHALLAEAFGERGGIGSLQPSQLSTEDVVFLARHHVFGSRAENGKQYLIPALSFCDRAYRSELALELTERALTVEGLLESGLRADVLLHRAKFLGNLGRREEQRACLEEMLGIAESLNDPVRLVGSLRQVGAFHWHVSNPREAEPCLVRAREVARRAGLRSEEGRCESMLGNVLENVGRYDEARDAYRRAIEIALETGSRAGEGTASGNLGVLEMNLGRTAEARVLLERHREIAHVLSDHSGEIAALTNLAVMASLEGKLEEALALTEESLVAVRQLGDRAGEGLACGNLGDVLWHLGRGEEALAKTLRSLEISCETGDRTGEVFALLNLGPIHAGFGRRAEARRVLEQAWSIARQIGARREESYAIHRLAEVAEQDGDPESAATLLAEALAIREQLGYRPGIAATRLGLGRLAAEAGRGEDAEEHFRAAMELASRVGDETGEVLAAAWLASSCGGDVGQALDRFRHGREGLPLRERLEVRYRFWLATGDREHLDRASRILDDLVAGAPPDAREEMMRRVPLHRAVAGARDGRP